MPATLEDPATVVATAGDLIMLATAMGAVASDLWVLPSAQTDGLTSILADIRNRLWCLLGLSLLVFTLTSVAGLILHTASMSEVSVWEAYPEIGTVLLKSHYGHLWLLRAAALLTLWITWGMRRRDAVSRLMPTMAVIALAVIALTLSASGHAGDDGILSLLSIANWLHILGAFLWGGGIIAAAIVILPMLLRTHPPMRELIATASLRLSTLAGIALALVFIPGLYNAWLQIDSWHGLWTSLYGQLLVAKLVLAGGMTTLGALNRYLYVPAIQRHANRPVPRTLLPLPRFMRIHHDTGAAPHFLRSLWIEGTLLLGVLLLAAALSQQTPPTHADHDNMPGHVHTGT